ncbi:hypothetical protein QYE76_018089 [Lolium multiflorum]|uniref:CASP-like protein n=1 Tax=Lolium multiflorum TaxID=4521 RepID=A0AAD8VEM6_LOLMU|nr:hypothetical protein QYE76_018089 [Lolium multiflorum]
MVSSPNEPLLAMARDKSGASNATSLALRIATVALSVASTVMMASASASTAGSPAPAPASNVSYSDYSSLRYSLAANVVSAALQALAVYLTMTKVRGSSGEHEAKAAKSLAQLVDTAAQVLLYSSSAMSFAVDDFGSCGQRLNGVCKLAGEFCRQVHVSGAISIAAAVALSVSVYIEDVPISVSLDGDGCKSAAGCESGCHCHH